MGRHTETCNGLGAVIEGRQKGSPAGFMGEVTFEKPVVIIGEG